MFFRNPLQKTGFQPPDFWLPSTEVVFLGNSTLEADQISFASWTQSGVLLRFKAERTCQLLDGPWGMMSDGVWMGIHTQRPCSRIWRKDISFQSNFEKGRMSFKNQPLSPLALWPARNLSSLSKSHLQHLQQKKYSRQQKNWKTYTVYVPVFGSSNWLIWGVSTKLMEMNSWELVGPQHPNNDNTVTPMVARCGLVSPVLAPSLAARGTAVFGSAGFGSAVSHQSSMLETQRLEVGIWIAHVHRVTMGYYGLPKHFPLVEGLVHTQKKNCRPVQLGFPRKILGENPKVMLISNGGGKMKIPFWDGPFLGAMSMLGSLTLGETWIAN